MTERKYPRTINEAFHNTVEYGAAIEKPCKRFNTVDKVMIAVSVLSLIVVALDLFFWRT